MSFFTNNFQGSFKVISFKPSNITVKDKNNNIFSVDKNDERYLSGELIHMNKNIKKSKETKQKMSDKAKLRIGKLSNQFGTCWITKDGINKKIKIEELNNYLVLQWIKGRILK